MHIPVDEKKHEGVKQNFRMKKRSCTKELSSLQEQRLKIGNLQNSEIKTFDQLPLSHLTKRGLIKSGFIKPTKVQSHSLVYSLQSRDVVVAAKTGSGKTLAFLIPVLEELYCKKWSLVDGLGALIVTPTGELAYQIFEVLKKIGTFHSFSAGLVIGGKDLKFEWNRVSKCNIIICTPGRLFQHMTENSEFDYDNVQVLVLDEADLCLSADYADSMNTIFKQLPPERQTLLYSATQTRDIKDLIRVGCKSPIFCSAHEFSHSVMPNTLNERYVVFEEFEKLNFLWSFLKANRKSKILVFLSTCKQVKYVMTLFTHLKPGLTVMGLHGGMSQPRRMKFYDAICKGRPAVLFATDIAARGLDIPSIDWVIHLDCPEDATAYIHRAGRTARHSKAGESLLVLTPTQVESILVKLKASSIYIKKSKDSSGKFPNMQPKIDATVIKYPDLKNKARRAFIAYLKNFSHMKDKETFALKSINLDAFARSLGLAVTPTLEKSNELMHSFGKKEMLDENRANLETYEFGLDDGDEDEFLVSSTNKATVSSQVIADKEIHKIPLVPLPLSHNHRSSLLSLKKPKVLTKYAIVKKLHKKKIQLNKKIIFDDEGLPSLNPCQNRAENSHSVMTEGGGGIDILKMKSVLREEDKIDKKQHLEKIKEKKRIHKAKLKALRTEKEELRAKSVDDVDSTDGEFDDVTENLISELPDPDWLYKNDAGFYNCNNIPYDSYSNKEKKTQKFSGKRKSKETSEAKKRNRSQTRNSIQDLSHLEKENLVSCLLKRENVL